MRQVTHALLTRPPLGYPVESAFVQALRPHRVDIPVRLACIKHAASVHPEPGSNSRIDVYVSSSDVHVFWYFFFKKWLRHRCRLAQINWLVVS